MSTVPRRIRAGLVGLLLVVSLSSCNVRIGSQGPSHPATSRTAPSGPSAGAGPAAATAGLKDLEQLTVAKPHSSSGYNRDLFPTWSDQGGGCNTRDLVLKRDGTGVQATSNCKITAGKWHSLYDGKDFTNPQQVDIDHTVPLANAWRSGADSWDRTRREAFANDLVRPQLLAVSASANRSKSDQDPSEWLPADQGYWCQYAKRWITVKRYWNLTVTSAEKSKLSQLLNSC